MVRPNRWQFALGCTLAIATTAQAANVVLDFEEISLAADSVQVGDETQSPLVSQGVAFNRTFAVEFDCCPGAWAASNRVDISTPGFTNSLSAYHLPNGGGVNESSNFMAANDDGTTNATIEFPRPAVVDGMYVTNTTYAYLAVALGDDGAGFVKGPFAADDYFRLTVRGLNANRQETGIAEFYLADFRDGKSLVVSSWTWMDLTGLGRGVSSMEFELESTDSGMFGMNTPAYFAIDDLTFSLVPEPTLNPCFLCVSGICMLGRRRINGRTRT